MEWDGLVRAMPRPSPFLLHGWLSEWWRHYGDGGSSRCTSPGSDGRLVGALPLMIRRQAGLRVARFMGGRQSVLAGSPARARCRRPRGRIAGRAAGRRRITTSSTCTACRRAAGSWPRWADRLHLIERIEAPVLDLLPELGRRLPAQDLREEAQPAPPASPPARRAGPARVTVARTPAELERALEEAFRLHALRWDGPARRLRLRDPTGQRFHRAALHRLARARTSRASSPSARRPGHRVPLLLRPRGCMYVHRLAFDPRSRASRPGSSTRSTRSRSASDEGLTRVEFLGGGERYKLELADRFEPLYHGLGLASGVRGRALLEARARRRSACACGSSARRACAASTSSGSRPCAGWRRAPGTA